MSFIKPCKWAYVKSKSNPVDLTTRGISVQSLIDNELWVKGPDFLRQNLNLVIERWKIPLTNLDLLPEERKVVLTVINVNNEDYLFTVIERHSNLIALIKVFVYILRFCDSLTAKYLILSNMITM